MLVEANDIIPADGTVIEGAASVSEGEVTGESAPVVRAADRNLSFVRRGTHVLSDWLVVRVRSREGFFDPTVTRQTPSAPLAGAGSFHTFCKYLVRGVIILWGWIRSSCGYFAEPPAQRRLTY